MRGYGRSAHPPDVPTGLDHKTNCAIHSLTSIDTDDPTFETTQYCFRHRPLGRGLGHDACALFRRERRLWKRLATGNIRRARLCWPHRPGSRRHQALPADVVAMAKGRERRLSHYQARRRGHALDALRLDVADATDRLDRRLRDGMLHDRPNIGLLGSGLSIGGPISATTAYHVH